jgi:putative transposase
MLVLNRKHLNVITRDYVDYDNRNRPNQGLAQRVPIPPDDSQADGEVIALPEMGGLHHHYRRAA